MRSETPCNDSWIFTEGFDPVWITAPLPGKAVSLPHTAVELPLSYFDEKSYQRAFTYQRVVPWRIVSRAARCPFSSRGPWPMPRSM